ncbi:hypothetical protein ACLOJK_020186 [Asimina triloba]
MNTRSSELSKELEEISSLKAVARRKEEIRFEFSTGNISIGGLDEAPLVISGIYSGSDENKKGVGLNGFLMEAKLGGFVVEGSGGLEEEALACSGGSNPRMSDQLRSSLCDIVRSIEAYDNGRRRGLRARQNPQGRNNTLEIRSSGLVGGAHASLTGYQWPSLVELTSRAIQSAREVKLQGSKGYHFPQAQRKERVATRSRVSQVRERISTTG